MHTARPTSRDQIHALTRVLLVANLSKPNAEGLVQEICHEFSSRGVDVTVFTFSGQASSLPVEQFDLAISLGGDGTVLFCARLLAHARVPILPINLGRVGFITEISPDRWREAINAYCAGRYTTSSRMLLSVRVVRGDKLVGEFTALNDAVISTGGTSKAVRLVHLAVSAADDSVHEYRHVAEYRADGLIVATPTGSTGYFAAAGGPIVHPELDAILMNPICPFTLSNRPLILPGNEQLKVLVQEHEREDLVLTMDGQTLFPIRADDEITVRRSHVRAELVRAGTRTFYEVLRRKLNWAGGEADSA
ncbi:MAG: NAD(+)/NADH kinase [Spirochaetales bacterium]